MIKQPVQSVVITEHEVRSNEVIQLGLFSDIHWDNPKCDRGLLKNDLDICKERGIKIAFNGDTFCLMQGKFDPRRSKGDIRDEHNSADYLNAIVRTAVAFFSEYAEIIEWFGYGNHETSVYNRMEFDVLSAVVEGINNKMRTNIKLAGYDGFWINRVRRKNSVNAINHNTYFNHGGGGEAAATFGILQHTRKNAEVEGADLIWMGHTHNSYEVEKRKIFLTSKNSVKLKSILNVRTGTYKEEFEDITVGWAKEKQLMPKPLGGKLLNLQFKRKNIDGHDVVCLKQWTTPIV